jgi:succinyl-diaminopimelate desuccinylase
MLKQIINLTQELIKVQSTANKPKKLQRVLEIAQSKVKKYNVKKFSKDGIPSLLIYNTNTLPKNFKVILNGHLDVVEGKNEQFKPVVNQERIYGRGADDMKAATAVLILLFNEIANKVSYPFALQLTTDEEIGGHKGTLHQAQQGITADFFITGETTWFNIKTQAKGVLWLQLQAEGKTAHGAYPWKGENAIWNLHQALQAIYKEFTPPKKEIWQTTVNLATIGTKNVTNNKVPEDASANLDIRYIPTDAITIEDKIKHLATKNITVNTVVKEPYHYTNPKNKYVQILQRIIKEQKGSENGELSKSHGASDARHYSALGTSAVEFGPIGNGLHSDSEWININSLKDYYNILQQFLLKI